MISRDPLKLQCLIISHRLDTDTLALKHTRPHVRKVVEASISPELSWVLEPKERNLDWSQKRGVIETKATFLALTSDQIQRLQANQKPLIPRSSKSIPYLPGGSFFALDQLFVL